MALSEEEAALYDRQIRLWGLDAQKRMRNSRILIAGLTGLGVEVAKNIVLSGVRSVTLLDHQAVTREDLSAQFYLSDTDIGSNRAQACSAKIQALNPMVLVSTDLDALDTKREEYFSAFDLVCLTGLQYSAQTITSVNSACRANNVKFIAGAVFGFFGFFFVDYLQHSYVEDALPSSSQPQVGKSHQAQQELDSAADGAHAAVKQSSIAFVDFSTALSVNWGSPHKQKGLRNTPKALFALLALLHSSSHDIHSLLQSRAAFLSSHSLPDSALPEEYIQAIAANIGAELSPVAAIVGGVYAQEALKGVSGKDQPLNNFFVFDATDGAGYVEAVAP